MVEIIGSIFQGYKKNPYFYQTTAEPAFIPSQLPIDSVRVPVDIFNRYYLDIANPNPLSGSV